MKSSYMQFIIQVLVLTIFGIGTTLAEGNVCLPGCSSCEPVTVMSCCGGMAGGPEHGVSSDQCPYGEICPGELEQNHELIVQASPSVEIHGPQAELIVFAGLFESTSLPVTLVPPPPVPLSPLYIFNCSFLI
jgi:hypothetical protein